MSPEQLVKLQSIVDNVHVGELKLRVGYDALAPSTMDIVTADYAFPPVARLWSRPNVPPLQEVPNEEVAESLIEAYNALPGLLEHIEDLTERIKELLG